MRNSELRDLRWWPHRVRARAGECVCLNAAPPAGDWGGRRLLAADGLSDINRWLLTSCCRLRCQCKRQHRHRWRWRAVDSIGACNAAVLRENVQFSSSYQHGRQYSGAAVERWRSQIGCSSPSSYPATFICLRRPADSFWNILRGELTVPGTVSLSNIRTGAAPEGARYVLLCPALLMLLQWALLLVAWSDSTMMAVCCGCGTAFPFSSLRHITSPHRRPMAHLAVAGVLHAACSRPLEKEVHRWSCLYRRTEHADGMSAGRAYGLRLSR